MSTITSAVVPSNPGSPPSYFFPMDPYLLATVKGTQRQCCSEELLVDEKQ
jgi:hypothetical protein